MKKTVSVLTAAVMLLSMLCMNGFSTALAETDGAFVYSVNDGKAVITDYNGTAVNLVIPSKLGGYPVAMIRDRAFENCTSIQTVSIPDGVTTVGAYAFLNTGYYKNAANWENRALYVGQYLLEVKDTFSGAFTVRAGTEIIGDKAFAGCSDLTAVTMAEGVTHIGDSAFAYCSALSSVTIPDSVCFIGAKAFQWCTSLKTVELPDGLQSISMDTFAYCGALTSISVPNSVTEIFMEAFYDCNGLKDVYFDGTEEEWNSFSIGVANQPLLDATVHFREDTLLGDLNGDGELDMRDAFGLYSAASGGAEPTEEQSAVADMNGDGEIDMRDAFVLYAQASGR